MRGSAEQAIGAALRGELVVVPTDTVYGIGARPDLARATAAIFAAKGRSRRLGLPLLLPSAESAEDVAVMDERAGRLAGGLWPGAITLVLPRTARSAPWDLGGDDATIGIRVPRHRLALEVLDGTGPLAVTSANPTGAATPSSCDEIVELFGDAVAVYVCEERRPPGRASTVIDLAHGDPVILRSGEVDERTIEALLAG